MDSPTAVPARGALRIPRRWSRNTANCRDESHTGRRALDLAERLHDDASQLLSLASMQLDRALHADADQARLAVDQARALVRDALAAVRAVIAEAHQRSADVALADVDLRMELQAMVASLRRRSGRSISYHEVLPPEREQLRSTSARASNALLGAARELVTNACKHTRKVDIELTLSWDACGLTIGVRDHGPGLPRDARPAFGLQLLHRRMAAIGAHVSLVSHEQAGLQARIHLPWA